MNHSVFFNVELLAFRDGEMRRVEVPMTEHEKAKTFEETLELVFHYGQNDFQMLKQPSVSVGDVIHFQCGDETLYFIVCGVGFHEITKRELVAYRGLDRRDRSFKMMFVEGEVCDDARPDDVS